MAGSDADLSPTDALIVERLCDSYEAAWKRGEPPQLEAYLDQSPATLRCRLFRELFLLELEYRRRGGTPLDASECQRRFPDDTEAWQAVLRNHPMKPAGTANQAPSEQTVDGPTRAGSATVPVLAKLPTRFVVGELVGRGGMGCVWRARDTTLGREVAIKVMLVDPAQYPDLARRFQEEVRITAQLQHPSIVPVHDLGQTEDGYPFLVMKLIKGQTLAKLLADREQPWEHLPQLVQVFGQLAQAIGYAHSRGTIHRDLKPSNVMVGSFGEVQVMDWGLAKVLPTGGDPEPATESDTVISTERQTGESTQHGQIMGTWAYMPPEQACGLVDKINQRSDVFALGAMLCETLTGSPAYVGEAGIIRQRAQEADLEETYTRLKNSTAPAELVTLAEKCLAARPRDRLADAGQVAAAVTAYQDAVQSRLEHEQLERERQQIKAAEDHRRQKLWAGITVSSLAACLLLAAGLGVTNHYRNHSQQQAEKAQQARLKTRQTLDQWTSTTLGWLGRQPEITQDQQRFLRQVLAQYETLAREDGGGVEERKALVQAHWKICQIRLELGLIDQAIEAAERSVVESRSLRGDFPSQPAFQEMHAEAQHRLADTYLRRGNETRGDYEKAAKLLQASIHTRGPAEDTLNLVGLVGSHQQLGNLELQRGRTDAAAAALEQALKCLGSRPAHDHSSTPTLLSLAGEIYLSRGFLHERKALRSPPGDAKAMRDLKQALRNYQQAVEYFEKQASVQPSPTALRQLAGGYSSLGLGLYYLARWDEAVAAHQRAVSIAQDIADEFPVFEEHQHLLAVCLNNLAIALDDSGSVEEAAEVYDRLIALRETMVEKYGDEVFTHHSTLSSVYCNYAHLMRDMGKPGEAIEWYDRAIKALEPRLQQDSQLVDATSFKRNAYSGRAQAYQLLEHHDQAISDFEASQRWGNKKALTAARIQLSKQDRAKATQIAERAIEKSQQRWRDYLNAARLFALAARWEPDASTRESYADRAIELLEEAIRRHFPNAEWLKRARDFDALRNRAGFQLVVDKLEAQAEARRAAEGDEPTARPDHQNRTCQ